MPSQCRGINPRGKALNLTVGPHHLLRNPKPLQECPCLLIQLEVPQSISIMAATMVHQWRGLVVLDLAPYAPIFDDPWQQVDIELQMRTNWVEFWELDGLGFLETASMERKLSQYGTSSFCGRSW